MNQLHTSTVNDLKIIQELRKRNKKLVEQKDLIEKTLQEMFNYFSEKMDSLESEYIKLSKDHDERK